MAKCRPQVGELVALHEMGPVVFKELGLGVQLNPIALGSWCEVATCLVRVGDTIWTRVEVTLSVGGGLQPNAEKLVECLERTLLAHAMDHHHGLPDFLLHPAPPHLRSGVLPGTPSAVEECSPARKDVKSALSTAARSAMLGAHRNLRIVNPNGHPRGAGEYEGCHRDCFTWGRCVRCLRAVARSSRPLMMNGDRPPPTVRARFVK